MRHVVEAPRRPGIGEVAGWDCAWRLFVQPGWYTATCSKDGAVLAFNITP
jgi:hypothetical protein